MKTIFKIPVALIIRQLLLVTSLLSLSACESFVQVDLPKSQLAAAQVFEEKNSAYAALSNIYAEIRDFGILTGGRVGMSYQLSHYADDYLYYGNPTSATQQFSANAVLPTVSTISNWWNITYNQIYAANALIEGVNNSSALSPEDRNRLVGEALFIRSLLHFYLLNIYGDVPYVISTDYKINQKISKTNVTALLKLLAEDLEQSYALSPDDYRNTERTHPNKYAVAALLSRVYLYLGQWPDAESYASLVIGNSGLYTLENPAAAFLKESRATIFQLSPRQPGFNTNEGTALIMTSAVPSEYVVNPDLVGAFDAIDIRKEQWLGEVTNNAETWYYVNKYKERTATGTSREYSILLRLPELYLIRAEARSQMGNFQDGLDDLNLIRNNSGLGNLAVLSQQELVAAIISERRLEFFGETGHRFFDLKRYGMLDEILNYKAGWSTADRNLPLPDSELLLNPNLEPQNMGY